MALKNKKTSKIGDLFNKLTQRSDKKNTETKKETKPKLVKKTPAKKAPAKKTVAKKIATKKAPAKKTITKKATAKKTATKKIVTKKPAAKKVVAKKTAAKKPATKKAVAQKKVTTKKATKKLAVKNNTVKRATAKNKSTTLKKGKKVEKQDLDKTKTISKTKKSTKKTTKTVNKKPSSKNSNHKKTKKVNQEINNTSTKDSTKNMSNLETMKAKLKKASEKKKPTILTDGKNTIGAIEKKILKNKAVSAKSGTKIAITKKEQNILNEFKKKIDSFDAKNTGVVKTASMHANTDGDGNNTNPNSVNSTFWKNEKNSKTDEKSNIKTVTKKSNKIKADFSVGDYIVYPAHGVGIISEIEIQSITDIEIELYVISFPQDKLRLRVPIAKALSIGMRPLSEQDDIDKALTILKGRARIKRTMWSRRAQEYETKIHSGSLHSVAEVVRDLFRTDEQPEQSYSEKQLFEQAIDRMAREIAAHQGTDVKETIEDLEQTLTAKTKAA